jgi:hypothetical protein
MPARYCTPVSMSLIVVKIPSSSTAGITVAANGVNRCGDWVANPIATSELDSADRYSDARPAASLTVVLAVDCRTKCSVTSADMNSACLSAGIGSAGPAVAVPSAARPCRRAVVGRAGLPVGRRALVGSTVVRGGHRAPQAVATAAVVTPFPRPGAVRNRQAQVPAGPCLGTACSAACQDILRIPHRVVVLRAGRPGRGDACAVGRELFLGGLCSRLLRGLNG